jgi:hypothetical protein
MTPGRRRLVRVPASTANMGPGFDVMAAALSLHLELEVLDTGTFAVETDLDVPADRTNLVVRAFERLHPSDGLTFRISSRIPLCGGLGSSAAAIVAGLIAANDMFALGADVRALATELEGHADNVAAALDGGFVICAGRRTRRFDAPLGLEAVLVVPEVAVLTGEARATLPVSRRATGRPSLRVCTIACISPTARGCTRGRSSCSKARRRSGPSARRSPGRGRRCSCGRTPTRRTASSSGSGARRTAGRG